MRPWRVLDHAYLARTPWLTLRADRCETSDGAIVDPYYVIECRDWVHIVAMDDQDRMLVTRQYRHGNRSISLEIPCGEVDPEDASPLDAAKREFLEETGYAAGEWVDAGLLHPNPARQGNLMYGFVARDLTFAHAPALDASEAIECEWLPVPEVLARIASGEFNHALHVAAVYLALHRIGRI